MLIFLVIFGVFAKFPSDGLPYPIFAFTAILVWFCFSQAATSAAQSLVADAALLKKVYFPRLLIPLAAVIRPVVDFAVSFILLLVMMAWYGIAPQVDNASDTAVPASCHDHRAGRRALAVCTQRAVSRRRSHISVSDSGLDVRLAGCLLDQSRPGAAGGFSIA